MLWRLRSFPDFVEPCLPSQVERPLSGADWPHEVKHDGKNSRYRSGRSRDWVKCKNPAAPAMKREAEEDWGKHRWR
jgi:ATP-dependent DNA ligase